MKKIMNIQKYTKFMIFLYEKEAFSQKISKDLFYLKFYVEYSCIFCNFNFWNFRQVVRHIGFVTLNFANLTTDSWSVTSKTLYTSYFIKKSA